MLTNIKNILIGFTAVLMACNLTASTAFKINGKTTTVKGLYKEHQDKFYDLEKQKFELIERLAHQTYLDAFWGDLAKLD